MEAQRHAPPVIFFFMWAHLVLLATHSRAHASTLKMLGTYPAIFVFGDSLSDTGNCFLSGNSLATKTAQYPYGETFPGWPTFRFSDGHLLVDLLGGPASTAFTEGLYIIEIGGNDYIYAFIAKYTPSFVISTLMPLVIRQIRNAAEALLDTGAKHFLFITITPLGCSPSMLTQADGVKDSDSCLEEYNFASYLHGASVKEEMARLRVSYPNASFLLMDYYGAFDYILKHKELFGFSETLKACCGAGEDYLYNFNPLDGCNLKSVSVCADPSKYMVWDGVHLTDSFNLQLFNQTFVTGTYLDFPYASQ